jgi:hypothetical protein
MTWNNGANVCGAAFQAAEATPEPQVAQPMPELEVAESLSQPFTRINCDRAGMTWNDAVNVCVAESLSQPLTRLDCDRASMTWNDAANVCGAASKPNLFIAPFSAAFNINASLSLELGSPFAQNF